MLTGVLPYIVDQRMGLLDKPGTDFGSLVEFFRSASERPDRQRVLQVWIEHYFFTPHCTILPVPKGVDHR
jgi:hypothetical protein